MSMYWAEFKKGRGKDKRKRKKRGTSLAQKLGIGIGLIGAGGLGAIAYKNRGGMRRNSAKVNPPGSRSQGGINRGSASSTQNLAPGKSQTKLLTSRSSGNPPSYRSSISNNYDRYPGATRDPRNYVLKPQSKQPPALTPAKPSSEEAKKSAKPKKPSTNNKTSIPVQQDSSQVGRRLKTKKPASKKPRLLQANKNSIPVKQDSSQIKRRRKPKLLKANTAQPSNRPVVNQNSSRIKRRSKLKTLVRRPSQASGKKKKIDTKLLKRKSNKSQPATKAKLPLSQRRNKKLKATKLRASNLRQLKVNRYQTSLLNPQLSRRRLIAGGAVASTKKFVKKQAEKINPLAKIQEISTKVGDVAKTVEALEVAGNKKMTRRQLIAKALKKTGTAAAKNPEKITKALGNVKDILDPVAIAKKTSGVKLNKGSNFYLNLLSMLGLYSRTNRLSQFTEF